LTFELDLDEPPCQKSSEMFRFSFSATVTSCNGSPYATGPLSCLSALSVCNVGLLWPNGWIKMPFGTKVRLGPIDFVLDGTQLPPRKGTQLPTFRSVSIVAKRSPISVTAELI